MQNKDYKQCPSCGGTFEIAAFMRPSINHTVNKKCNGCNNRLLSPTSHSLPEEPAYYMIPSANLQGLDVPKSLLSLGFRLAETKGEVEKGTILYDFPKGWQMKKMTFSSAVYIFDEYKRRRVKCYLEENIPTAYFVPMITKQVDISLHIKGYELAAENTIVGVVSAADYIIYCTPPENVRIERDGRGDEIAESKQRRKDAYEKLNALCDMFLRQYYPAYKNPLAYW